MVEEYNEEYNEEYKYEKPNISNIINYIVRYEEHDETECWIRLNDTSFHILFCKYCGNYFDEKYANTNLFCLCDRESIIYETYQNVIENFADYTSGDEIDDYIVHPEYANRDFMHYIYGIVLFGMTYKKEKVEKEIEMQILDYVI